jgi:hypothetical protein
MFATAVRRHDALARHRASVGSEANPIDLDFFRPERHRLPERIA